MGAGAALAQCLYPSFQFIDSNAQTALIGKRVLRAANCPDTILRECSTRVELGYHNRAITHKLKTRIVQTIIQIPIE
jgi:hypothetical protein